MSSENAMTVAVTGSTGFVGRHTVRALADRGTTVRALYRNRDKARTTLPEASVEPVQGDVLDPASLDQLLEGCQAVVHTVGIIREREPSDFQHMHVRAVRNVIEAAERAGVSRMVHISALGVRPDAPTAYQRSKYDGEMLVRRSGLDWTIFRPSLIHGHDGEFVQMVSDMALGRMAPYVFMPYFANVDVNPPDLPKPVSATVQPVAVQDVAGAVVAALGCNETIGEVYPLGGSETLTWPEVLETIRDAHPLVTNKRRVVPVPAPLGKAVAEAARPLGLAAALPFGASEPVMAAEDSVCSNDKANRHFGFEPRPFRQAVEQYAAQL